MTRNYMNVVSEIFPCRLELFTHQSNWQRGMFVFRRQNLRKHIFRSLIAFRPYYYNNFSRRYCLQSLQRHPAEQVVFSGIQPTGVPHIGNYLGALQQWVRLQTISPPTTELYFSIVDLHALTTKPDRTHLRRWKIETLATLLAIGLDPDRCTIFFQSDVCHVVQFSPLLHICC